ncbi:MAG: transposase [Anaerolineae bacterium]|nr:transposase [Phycisphaerae bacterium]
MIDSMRGLQQASALEKVAEALGVKRFSLGSFSESCRLFDPTMLRAVIEQLSARAAPLLHDPRLNDLRHLLTLVDGTVLETIATVADAFWRDYRDGTPHHAWRLHTHFELQRSIPCDVELTDAVNSGDSDEKGVLRRKLKADRCYVMDRGYAQFTLFNDIHRAASSYVCRMKENSVYDVVEERELGRAARDGQTNAPWRCWRFTSWGSPATRR